MSLEIDPKVNLGHILIMVGMLGSGISAYVAARVTLNDHALKIEVMEANLRDTRTSIERQSVRNEDMNNALWGIKSDIAIIRQKVESSLAAGKDSVFRK